MIRRVIQAELHSSRARDVFQQMLVAGQDATEAMRDLGIASVDRQQLVDLCRALLDANPRVVADVRQGRPQAQGSITLRAQREPGADGDAVRIEVEDTGPGMDPATLERATAPGFTTKSTGSGLGLTLVQRVVEQHGGRFGLESNPGIGTRAWLTLPAAPPGTGAGEAPADAGPDAVEPVRGGNTA